MALEMKVPKEISAYEARPMFGLTWRRLASLTVMVVVGGGVFAVVSFAIATGQGGTSAAWKSATNIAMYVMLPVVLPAAWWGWFRPMGLKPEIHAQYFLRYHLLRKVLNYEDTYHLDAGEPVRGAAARAGRTGRAERRAQARRRRTVSEHEEAPNGTGRRGTTRPGRAHRH